MNDTRQRPVFVTEDRPELLDESPAGRDAVFWIASLDAGDNLGGGLHPHVGGDERLLELIPEPRVKRSTAK